MLQSLGLVEDSPKYIFFPSFFQHRSLRFISIKNVSLKKMWMLILHTLRIIQYGTLNQYNVCLYYYFFHFIYFSYKLT